MAIYDYTVNPKLFLSSNILAIKNFTDPVPHDESSMVVISRTVSTMSTL